MCDVAFQTLKCVQTQEFSIFSPHFQLLTYFQPQDLSVIVYLPNVRTRQTFSCATLQECGVTEVS